LKIGEFARLFEINKETVRYYTDKKLLTPVKSGSYYDYNQNCVDEMQTILKLKSMNFHLDEIAQYLKFFRLSIKTRLLMKKELVKLFKNKIEELDDRMHQIKTARTELNNRLEEILSIEDYNEGTEETIGFPVEYLSKLFCPVCGKKLNIINGEIAMNDVIEGQFKCECDYQAAIKEGVLVFEGALYDNTFEKEPEKKNSEKMLPPEYVSAVSASSRWLQDKLLKEDFKGKVIFDHSTNYGVMSNQLIDTLTDKTSEFTYIGLDIHYHLMKNFKRIFSMNKIKPKAIFMAGKFDYMPFKREFFDFIACSASLQSYSIFHREFPVEKILPFLKTGGKWFGNFFCVKNKREVSEEYRDNAELFCCDDLKEAFSNLNRLSFMDVGKVNDKGELSFYFNEEATVRFFVFAGEK